MKLNSLILKLTLLLSTLGCGTGSSSGDKCIQHSECAPGVCLEGICRNLASDIVDMSNANDAVDGDGTGGAGGSAGNAGGSTGTTGGIGGRPGGDVATGGACSATRDCTRGVCAGLAGIDGQICIDPCNDGQCGPGYQCLDNYCLPPSSVGGAGGAGGERGPLSEARTTTWVCAVVTSS